MSAEATALPRWPVPRSLKPLLAGLAAAITAGVFVVLWARGPSFTLLYTNLGASDQASVAGALNSADIAYRLEPGSNGISVPAEKLNDARLRLAGQGLPEGNGSFALPAQEPGSGLPKLTENARYQHALETELARTISSLSPVEGARVHIGLPQQSASAQSSRPPSASVFVKLKPGRRLEQKQIQAVVNLVASSIPEAQADHVKEPAAFEEEVERIAFWERPAIRDIGKLLIGLISLILLVFMVVKPLVKGLLQLSREASLAQSPPPSYEQQLAQARALVSQDPKRVAQLVKTWVNADD